MRISQDVRLIHYVEKALTSDDPNLQLLALAILASFETDEADQILEKAMKSNFIFIRIEAAFILATKQKQNATRNTLRT